MEEDSAAELAPGQRYGGGDSGDEGAGACGRGNALGSRNDPPPPPPPPAVAPAEAEAEPCEPGTDSRFVRAACAIGSKRNNRQKDEFKEAK